MQECIGKTCELGRGDLAFMLGSYCYSVSCSSGRVCQTIPAQPSKFYPRIAFLKWAPKINETGQMNIVVIYTYFFFLQHWVGRFWNVFEVKVVTLILSVQRREFRS